MALCLPVLRQYALLSSQPVLSEDDTDRISEILEIAETNDGLALLLSQVDQALLESTDLLSDDAQTFYADQTSRILEFLTLPSETSCSKELLNLLLDQCARSDSSFVLSIEDPPLPWVITPPMSYSKSRSTMRQRAGFLIAALTTGAALMTGVAIVSRQCFASILQISSLPWETVKTSAIKLSPPVYPSASARLQPSSSTERQATVIKTALLDRQQSEEDQQFSIEQAQLQAEQRQREAELKQIVAEKQNQYQIALLPVSIPASLLSCYALGASTAAAIAYLRGYAINSQQVRTMILLCLLGESAKSVLQTAGVQIGNKAFKSVISQIPGKVLIGINKNWIPAHYKSRRERSHQFNEACSNCWGCRRCRI
ncbi:hypothetical protein H6F51_02890 [Cyanobacteria bacterium FACHB-DQ100]|nr:hypothetical protein [Cyanobacteria bacterium FACHB-DQ100]